MEKSSYKPKRKFYKRNDNNKPKDLEDKVVYVSKPSGPVKKADWQLMLMAISDCLDKQDDPNYKKIVNLRYEELKHRN